MADRYWVGGTGTWNTTSTTNWSASSGGASGASVPTVADNVFFDQAGTYTVTVNGALACLDITVSAGTVTFSSAGLPTLTVAGSLSFIATTTWSAQTVFTFTATTTGKTVTASNTLSSSAFNFNGIGGGWTLGSAISLPVGSFTVTAGSVNSANYSITCFQLVAQGTSVRSLTLGSSTVTVTATTANAIACATITNLTFNAGTSQINLTGGSTTGISSGGLTFYNIAFTSTAAGTKTVTGVNTYNNFAVTAPSAAGVATITFSAQQTINGTLSTTGTAGNRRVFFASATYGISVDLVVNSAPSLTDADFRGLYVRGTSAPISGTRIGNRGECRGITFDAPKTVYWNLAGAQNWSANGWATTSTGAPSTNNFPLPQDTATFTNAGSVTGTITLDTAIGYVPNVNMSGRTTAMTLSVSNPTTVYGNWTNGTGTSLSGGTSELTFSGGGTQTITSAGVQFFCGITINTFGGTVELADALIGFTGFGNRTITNGTFDTKGYAVSTTSISSANFNVRQIKLGASTVTLTSSQPFFLTLTTNLTFDAGTSNITCNGTVGNFTGGGNSLVFYNLSYTNTTAASVAFEASCTFNNLTFTAPASGISTISFSGNQTINGTLTCAGASAVRRVFLRSDTIGTQRTLTVNSISATDCDFRDIVIAGTAAGTAPTRAGDCGGNSGITFPAAKTVYWNLAGAQNWSATGWCPSSGGTPDINQFPLAQDTAVFDNTGSVTGTITIERAWNIGTFDASLRTGAMTLTTSTNNPAIYGDWKFGTGVTSSSTTGVINFQKNGTQTITSNGVQFGCPVTINHPSGTVQLADALSLAVARTLTLTSGTFDAVTYNVTAGAFSSAAGSTTRMGAGTWTMSGTGTVWSGLGTIVAGTSTIVLSDTSAGGRTFSGGGLYYNKLTIGGTTGTSTLTISGNNSFGELASTKTVAHTIALGTTAQTFGKWSVTGTVGNVVTLTGTGTTHVIAGPAVTGIDYLAMGSIGFSTTSPGEFYAGANSTGTAAAPVFRTAAPAPRTLYWVGGTGNWSSTTKWAASSGGPSGEPIPTSLDAVNFDSASNATAYTATVDAGVTLARCASFTMAGPTTGNVTFAGSVGIAFHGNVSFAATGITRTYTGAMNWAGNASYTFTTNGLTLASTCTVIGVGSTWALGFNTNIGINFFIVTYGTFTTSASNYSLNLGLFSISGTAVRVVNLNGSTVSATSNATNAFNASANINLTFNAGTSQINLSGSPSGISSAGLTFYNVSFTSAASTGVTITGANTFNNLTFAGRTTVGITPVTFIADQTINGTLTVNAGTASAFRNFLASNTLGTTRTLTCAAVSATDVDFRDITIAGAAAPASGTRLGDAKGNSGITFPAAKTVYWALAGSNNWGNTGAGSWSATSGGAAAADQFPLAQDTAVIPFATPTSGSIITVNAAYNIGTLDMSNRNGSAVLNFWQTASVVIYGNWITGTGVSYGNIYTMQFSGRGSQTLTSAGKTIPHQVVINSPSGSVTLADAMTLNWSSGTVFVVTQGTFDAASYNVTLSGAASGVSASGTGVRTVAIGSGTWTIAGNGGWAASTSTNLTATGTGTISLTSASAKTFAGGGISYSGITLNQGGAGALTVSGNNTFKTINNTYSATGATSIALGGTTQTLIDPWTATGAAGRVLTLSGTSAASPATLVYTGAGVAANTVDYLSISNVRAYPLVDEWYAGANSTNGGTLGWYFVAAGGTVYAATITETGTGSDSILARAIFNSSISETGTGTDSISAALGGITYLGTIEELATGSDAVLARAIFRASLAESGTGTDTISARSAFGTAILESATIADTNLARLIARATLSETAAGSDTESASLTARSTLSESATITDADVGRISFPTVISETASGSDTDAASLTINPAISETATGTDAVSARAIFLAAVAESGTITDLISALKGFFVVILESATGTDTFSAAYTTNPSIVESASITDAVAARYIALPSIFESASGSDIVVGGLRFIGVVAESATGTETVAARYISNPSIAETATGSDTDAARLSAAGIISETATGTEAITARATFKSDISEYSSVVEIVRAFFTAAAQVSELATGTDQVSALRALAAAVAETATITDSLSARAVFIGRLQEAATAQDAVNAPGSTYNILMQELAIAQDAISAKARFSSVIAETTTGTDTYRAAFIPRATISESATITDAASALPLYAARILETSAAADSVLVAPSIFNAIAVASATAIDNLNAPGSIYNVTIPESATLSDSVLGAYLWNLIDDSQPESWQNVLDAQSVTWSAINASQTAGWGEVDSAQATSWGNADSAQAPGWQDVQTSQTGTWNSVDDSQSVNWQNVVNEQPDGWNAANASQPAGWGNTGNAQSGTWNNIDDDQDPDWVDIPTLK